MYRTPERVTADLDAGQDRHAAGGEQQRDDVALACA